jgi:hypothetical protein
VGDYLVNIPQLGAQRKGALVMRTTCTKRTDYEQMLKLAKSNIGKKAIEVIEMFAAKRKIVSHRAGKVFWSLVDDGEIGCKPDQNGYEIIVS